MIDSNHERIMETYIPITLWPDEQMMKMEILKADSILVV